MNNQTRTLTLAALVMAALPWAAMATGNHAGGHGHENALIGQPGKPDEVTRTVEVEMLDTMRFSPATFSVRQGETLRFKIRNAGKLKHEFVLGTKKDLDAHYEVMKKFPEMEHADDNMLSLAPGQAGELLWKFTRTGKVHIACLHPGHYDAGMKGEVTVAHRKAAKSTN